MNWQPLINGHYKAHGTGGEYRVYPDGEGFWLVSRNRREYKLDFRNSAQAMQFAEKVEDLATIFALASIAKERAA